MTTIYLCIGLPKTGTTATQTFLSENRDLLEKQGYCFPELKTGTDSRFKNRNGHFLAYRSDHPDKEMKKQEENAIREKGFQLLEKLANTYPNIVLSDEAIWKISAQKKGFWEDITERFKAINCQLRVIVYLRRQDLFIQSLWNQNIKSQVKWTKKFDDFIEKKAYSYFPLNYYEQLTRIAGYIGQENIIVRVYEHGQFEGNGHCIYSDFLQCIGLEMSAQYTNDNVKSNLGLRGNYIEIKRIVNTVPEYRQMTDFLCSPVKSANNCLAKGSLHTDTSMFSYAQQKTFLERYEESNRKIAEQFLNRSDGRLFYEPLKEYPKWEVKPDTMYRDIILLMTEIACTQQKEILHLKEEMLYLKKGIKSLRKIQKVYWKMRNLLPSIHKE